MLNILKHLNLFFEFQGTALQAVSTALGDRTWAEWPLLKEKFSHEGVPKMPYLLSYSGVLRVKNQTLWMLLHGNCLLAYDSIQSFERNGSPINFWCLDFGEFLEETHNGFIIGFDTGKSSHQDSFGVSKVSGGDEVVFFYILILRNHNLFSNSMQYFCFISWNQFQTMTTTS